MNTATDHRTSVRVWDPLIRIFHWTLAGSFFVAYVTEDDFFTLHKFTGYTITLLVLFRLVWGLIGTRHARFSDFVAGPNRVLSYLKQLISGRAPRYLGHNPAGAAMIVFLLSSLVLTAFSGMLMIAPDGHGPLANTFLAALGGEWLEEVHEAFANTTLGLVFFHVAGVIVSSLLHGENLVRAMMTGRKVAEIPGHPIAPANSHTPKHS